MYGLYDITFGVPIGTALFYSLTCEMLNAFPGTETHCRPQERGTQPGFAFLGLEYSI